MRSKGDAAIGEVILLIGIALGLVFFAVMVLPKFINSMMGMLALNSADAMSRDLAGLITISGAATDRMTIDFNPKSTYDVTISERVVVVHVLEGIKDTAWEKAGLDSTCPDSSQCIFKSINDVKISKSLDEQKIKCEVTANAV
jgi:hypothetical protein